MNKTIWTLMSFIVFTLSACERQETTSDRGAPPAQAPDVALTHVTQATQLFVEFPALVRGEESSFAAHLTRLVDFKPVADGTLTVTLSGGGFPDERGQATVSKTPGIFKPVLKPQYVGIRRLRFIVDGPNLHSTHDLGDVEV